MRVIRLAWDYPAGGKPTFGLQPVFYYLSRAQAARGYDVQVVTKAKSHFSAEVSEDGVTVHHVPDPFSPNAYKLVRELSKAGEQSVIHSHATCGVFLPVTKLTSRVPVISHVHGCSRSAHMPITLRFGESVLSYSATENWYRYFRERLLWSRANRVLAVSGSVKSDLGTTYGIPSSKVDVVYNGVDTRIFRQLPDFSFPSQLRVFQNKRIVLYVGHFGLRKGILFLIRAMKAVVREVPDAVLVCVGGVPGWLGNRAYWEYLERCIKGNDLDGKVLLLDKVPNGELPSFYSAAELFVLPSYYEAFAKVIIEAMACGKPVVVTKGGGPAEAVDDGKTGLLVDYGSETQLSEAILRVLEDENLSKRLGSNAKSIVEKNFTWDAVADRISRAYEQVLAEQFT